MFKTIVYCVLAVALCCFAFDLFTRHIWLLASDLLIVACVIGIVWAVRQLARR